MRVTNISLYSWKTNHNKNILSHVYCSWCKLVNITLHGDDTAVTHYWHYCCLYGLHKIASNEIQALATGRSGHWETTWRSTRLVRCCSCHASNYVNSVYRENLPLTDVWQIIKKECSVTDFALPKFNDVEWVWNAKLLCQPKDTWA